MTVGPRIRRMLVGDAIRLQVAVASAARRARGVGRISLQRPSTGEDRRRPLLPSDMAMRNMAAERASLTPRMRA